MSVNKVILVGRLGKDPEVRQTQGGAAVANFTIATSETWKDKNSGQRQDRTEWHRIVVWGKLADLCKQFLSKGRQVYIEGRLQTRQWQDQQGQTRYTTEVNAQTVQFLGNSAGQSAGSSAGMGAGAEYAGGNSSGGYASSGGYSGAGYEGGGAPLEEPSFTEDDVPF